MNQSEQTEDLTAKQPFWRRNLAPIMAGALLAGTISATALTAPSQQAAVDEARAEVTVAQEELAEAREVEEEAVEERTQEVAGVSVDRKTTDDSAIESVMSTALTWSTGEEYNEARALLISTYGISEDSAFMQSFLPDQMCNQTSSGEQVCLVDTDGLSSSFDSFESTVVGINLDEYEYFALVKMRIPSTDGETYITQTVPMRYTIDGDGNVSDLAAYPASVGVTSTN